MMRVLERTLVCLGLLLAAACDSKPDAAKAPAPAAVANPVTEASLSTITLTPEAEKRLGIATATAQVESIVRTRVVGGEVVIPPGRSVTVNAPMAGTVQASTVPRGGMRVQRGQALFTLFPLQAGERDLRIEADRAAAAAAAELQAAELRLTRLEALLKDGATSVRAVEEARAQQQVAAAAAEAARTRVESLRGGAVGTRGEIAVRAPLTGVLQDVAAAPGQTVASGSPLFTVAQTDALWVKVPLYVGDRELVDSNQPVTISGLGSGSGTTLIATRVSGPPSANPTTSTTDLFYAPKSGAEILRSGERVSVQLPLRESESALVVPAASLLYDLNGGTWVYEALGNHVFARRRVDVKGQSGNKTLIARGLQAGQKVVTDGAAELFGTEFGAGK